MANPSDLDDPHRFIAVGDISSERALQAKRNLFVFCATILIIHFNPVVRFSDISIFGLKPFTNSSYYSYFGLILTTSYLFIYWIIHYRLSWLAWYGRIKQLNENTPIRILLGVKSKDKSNPENETHYFYEPVENTDYAKRVKIHIGNDGSRRYEERKTSIASMKYVRLQLIFYWLGAIILPAMAITTLVVLISELYSTWLFMDSMTN